MKSLFVFFAAIFSFNNVYAHAHIVETEPVKESSVKLAPKDVVVKFSESLEIAMSKVEVKNSANGEVVSEKTMAGIDSSTLKVHLKVLKNEKAKYEVNWKAVSKDSHTMKGSYSFTVDPNAK